MSVAGAGGAEPCMHTAAPRHARQVGPLSVFQAAEGPRMVRIALRRLLIVNDFAPGSLPILTSRFSRFIRSLVTKNSIIAPSLDLLIPNGKHPTSSHCNDVDGQKANSGRLDSLPPGLAGDAQTEAYRLRNSAALARKAQIASVRPNAEQPLPKMEFEAVSESSNGTRAPSHSSRTPSCRALSTRFWTGGRDWTMRDIEASLRRKRKRGTLTDGGSSPGLPPADLVVLDHGDGIGSASASTREQQAHELLANKAMSRRPESPNLVGDERFEVFFVQKMRDWREWCPVQSSHQCCPFIAYLEDLRNVLYLPSPDTNPRALCTSRQLEPITRHEFSKHGHWLIPTLVDAAVLLALFPKGTERLVQMIHTIILSVAERTVGDARGHPLLVLHRALFDGQGIRLPGRLLRHCSTLCQESFGVGSLAHLTLDDARSNYLYLHKREGNIGEAATIVESLMETLSHGSPDQQHHAQFFKCQLPDMHRDRHKYREAERLLLGVLEYCRRASEEQGLPIARMESPLPETYHNALEILMHLSQEKSSHRAAKAWAKENLLHCMRAFGTSDIKTIRTVYDLANCLERQEKWMDREALFA